MKEFEVRAPDGHVEVVKAEEGTSPVELMRLAIQQREASTRQPPTFGQQMLTSAPGRLVKGMKDQIDAGAQLLPRGLSMLASAGGMLPNRVSNWLDSEAQRVDQGIRAGEQEYQAARTATGRQGVDALRIAGNILSPANLALAKLAPAAVTTTAGRVALGAGMGAAGGLMTPVTDTSETSFAAQKAGQTLVGAASGAVFAPIAGKVFDLVAPKIKALQARLTPADVLGARASLETDVAITQALREAGMDEAQVPEALKAEIRSKVLEAFRSGNRLDPAALLRQDDFKKLGMPWMQPQVTRDPGPFSQMMNLRGVDDIGLDGNPIRATLQAQNRMLTDKVAGLGGPKAADPVVAGRQIAGALKQADAAEAAKVTGLYTAARESAGKATDVPTGGLASDIGRIADDFGVGGEPNAIPTAIFNRLRQFGFAGDDGMTQRKVFDYEAADKLLKQINAHDNGQNRALEELREAVKRAITDTSGPPDPFTPARQAAAQRFARLDAVPGLEAAAKARNNIDLERVGDTFIQQNVFSAKPSDVQRLAKELPSDMFDEVKRQLAARLYRGAFGENASGDKGISPAGLQNAIRQIGREKLRAFFTADELAQIERTARVSAYINTDPAASSVSRGSNVGGALFGQMARLPGLSGSAGLLQAMAGPITRAQTASSAMQQTIPLTPNLTPEEIRLAAGLLGVGSASFGGLLAPRP